MDVYQDAWLRTLDRLGELIFKDDEKDFPRFSFEGHPSPVHHWQVGLAMRGTSALARVIFELLDVAGILQDDGAGTVQAPLPVEDEIGRLLGGR